MLKAQDPSYWPPIVLQSLLHFLHQVYPYELFQQEETPAAAAFQVGVEQWIEVALVEELHLLSVNTHKKKVLLNIVAIGLRTLSK